jgi:hypothetical protein
METSTNKQVVMEAHFHCWQKSGMSKSAYCQAHGLGYHTFLYWAAKTNPPAESAGSFSAIALPAKALAATAQLEIAYPSGTIIRLQGDFSAAFIKSLL